MVRQHYQLNEHESEHTLGDNKGNGTLACCSPRGHKELDITTKQQQMKATTHVTCKTVKNKFFSFLS